LYLTNIDTCGFGARFSTLTTSVELFAHGCQSQLLPLVSITQAAFSSYDGWQDGECPFFESDYFQNVSCCTGDAITTIEDRKCTEINGKGKASASFTKRIMVYMSYLRSQVSPEAPLDPQIVITHIPS